MSKYTNVDLYMIEINLSFEKAVVPIKRVAGLKAFARIIKQIAKMMSVITIHDVDHAPPPK